MNESHTYPSVTIKNIKFKNHEHSFNFNEDDIVLFVGANNVGKSRTLKDIKELMMHAGVKIFLIDQVDFYEHNFTEEGVISCLKDLASKNNNEDEYVFSKEMISYAGLDVFTIKEVMRNSSKKHDELYRLFFIFLSTEYRLNLVDPIKISHLPEGQILRILNKLRTEENLITELNQVLDNNFKKGIEIDDSSIEYSSSIKYKIGDINEISDLMRCERREVYQRIKKLENLHEQGDGLRSAVAILASLIVNKNMLYLIDEPETFLHPPQARQLGRDIVSLSKGKQCFIATHNIDFIRGVLESGSSRVKIIKIDRNGNENKYNCLDNESVRKISNDKNLKYSNILNGLFYKHVILCEDESDCKFYSAILEVMNTETYQNTLFCAVGGKGQFSKIVPLLNSLHINWYIIADLDLINNTETVKHLLDSIGENKYREIANEHRDFLRLFQDGTNSEIKKQRVIQNEIEKIFKTAKDDEFISKETVLASG